MGEVHRARDTKLGREVALKLLPEDFARDPERLARFRREAKVLASLQHPNIAGIFGLEEAEGRVFLVMELAEGEDLSHRIEGGALGAQDALEIAGQLASGLEEAHERGVVHRDLKPANIKVGSEGKVKILDFGLARAYAGESGEEGDPEHSPTITAAMSQAGVILGTAAYMSPEQARGKKVDRRADIWSFGVVLFEMLTGRQLFKGETISDTLAAVIKDEPDWGLLPADTPPVLTEVVKRCLEKNVRRRLQSIGEARIALEGALHGTASGVSGSSLLSASTAAAIAEVPSRSSRRSRTVAWAVALVLVALTAGYYARGLRQDPVSQQARRFHIQSEGLSVSYPRNPALSPDGRHVAYFTTSGLALRDLFALEPVLIPGTEHATSPFWSPDGAWLAYGMEGRIYKAPAEGGAPVVVCQIPFATLDGASWGEDGFLYLSPSAGPIHRVSERGGDAAPLFPLEPGETDYHTPSVLPDGRGVLFTTHNAEGRHTIEVFSESGRKVLLKIPGSRLEYATWAPGAEGGSRGYLVFHRMSVNPGIWAAPFDLEALALTGEPVLLDTDGVFPSLGRDGSLLYAAGAEGGPARLVVVDRTGKVLRSIGQPQYSIQRLRVSPDGNAILLSAVEGDNQDIWLVDVVRGTRTRMSFELGTEGAPGWFAGGKEIFYSSNDGVTYRRPADGSRDSRLLTQGFAASLVDGSEWFAFNRFVAGTGQDIYYAPLDSTRGEPRPLLQTEASEMGAELSPDGRFIAYVSDESGNNEVYLRPFPEGEGKWQVSTRGGVWPRWSPEGDEILYRSGAGPAARMISVPVQTSPAVSLGNPEVLFSAEECPSLQFTSGFPSYDFMPGGREIVMVERVLVEGGSTTRLVYAENWLASYLSQDAR